jgi:hypothetical protein
MTLQIEYAIDLALDAPPQNPTITMKGLRGMKPGEVRVVERKRPHHEIIDPDLIFPGCRQMPSRTGLPRPALRHTFKTLHVGMEISETLSALLMGHALKGVSAKYIAEIIVMQGPSFEKHKRRSARTCSNCSGSSSRSSRRTARAEMPKGAASKARA